MSLNEIRRQTIDAQTSARLMASLPTRASDEADPIAALLGASFLASAERGDDGTHLWAFTPRDTVRLTLHLDPDYVPFGRRIIT